MGFKTFKFSKITLGKLGGVIILLILTFYPLVNIVPISLGIANTPFNYVFRISYLLLSVIIIFGFISLNQRDLSIRKVLIPCLIFWFFYGFRLFYDLSLIDVITYDNLPPSYFYFKAFGTCFIPSLAIALSSNYIEVEKLNKRIYHCLIISNIILLFLFFKAYGVNILSFALRPDLGEMGGIGPIYYSRFGAMLMIWSFYDVLFNPKKLLTQKILFFIGFLTTIIGASRAPIIFALFICVIIKLYQIKQNKVNYSGFLKMGFKYLLIAFIIMSFIIPFIDFDNFIIVGRLEAINEVDNPRLIIWKQGWNQFLENPLFGDKFLLRDIQNGYVHNISIGALMSVGLIGGFFYLLMIAIFLYKIFIIYNIKYLSHYFMIGMTAFLWFCMAQFSNAIYSLPSLWSLLFFITYIKPEKL